MQGSHGSDALGVLGMQNLGLNPDLWSQNPHFHQLRQVTHTE